MNKISGASGKKGGIEETRDMFVRKFVYGRNESSSFERKVPGRQEPRGARVIAREDRDDASERSEAERDAASKRETGPPNQLLYPEGVFELRREKRCPQR